MHREQSLSLTPTMHGVTLLRYTTMAVQAPRQQIIPTPTGVIIMIPISSFTTCSPDTTILILADLLTQIS